MEYTNMTLWTDAVIDAYKFNYHVELNQETEEAWVFVNGKEVGYFDNINETGYLEV